jgi:hypothetical protein
LAGVAGCVMQLRHETLTIRRYAEYAQLFLYNQQPETSSLSLTISQQESKKEQLLESKAP